MRLQLKNKRGKLFSFIGIWTCSQNLKPSSQNCIHYFMNYNPNLLLLAPSGCLQYFRERNGTVSSFNWNPVVKRQYNKNQYYAIWLVINAYLIKMITLVSGSSILWCEEMFYLLEHSLIANKRQEVGINCLYLIEKLLTS